MNFYGLERDSLSRLCRTLTSAPCVHSKRAHMPRVVWIFGYSIPPLSHTFLSFFFCRRPLISPRGD